MRIIKKGNNRYRVWGVICSHCGTELEYNSGDIIPNIIHDYVVCPVCKKHIEHCLSKPKEL